jgi:hypothetical protein
VKARRILGWPGKRCSRAAVTAVSGREVRFFQRRAEAAGVSLEPVGEELQHLRQLSRVTPYRRATSVTGAPETTSMTS